MRLLLPILCFFSIILASCAKTPAAPEPAPVEHIYAYSDASILNPERGFFTPYELPGSAGFSPVRATDNTLVHLNIRLDDWRETDIPQDILDGLQTNFDDIRDGGVKAIIRFAYNQGPFPDTEPDASKAQILRHIEQLTPLLQNNVDIVAWLEVGFIGAWGEWHTSTNGLDNLPDKQEILFALLKALPETRNVQVRYPANIIEMFPEVIVPRQAYEGSNQARTGYHNDCFLSSDTDVGTYERDGVNTIVRDQAYLAVLTRFTPMSGETCAPNPPRSECTSALQEMAMLHFSAINEAYHKGILRSWDEGGCMEEITNRMGYRLSLTSVDFNEQVRPGGILDLAVNLQNTGFASLINKRPLYFVLAGLDGTSRYEVQAYLDEIEPRIWLAGAYSFSTKLHIPSNAVEGEYHLSLWLPDDYESLRNDPRYSVRFANENVWDESTGLNILGTVSITELAGGSFERGKEFKIISTEGQMVSDFSQSPPLVAIATQTSMPVSSSSDLIFGANVENDENDLTIRFEFVGDVASYNGFQVLLDTDQNPETGLSIEGIGADFLLENDALDSYAGSGSDWMWTPVETELTFDNEDQIAKWTLPRIALGDSSNIDIVFQLADTNWDTAFVTDKLTYILK